MLKRGLVGAGLAAGWVAVFLAATLAWAANPDEREAQVGKEAAAQVEKEYKIAKLPDQVDRVSSITGVLAAASPRPAVKYNCKVLDSFEINAFSLPGGYLYLTRGLLSAVESDDELAAVIAHEIAHNCKRHGMALIEKQAKIDKRLTMATLAAIIAGAPVNPENIAVAGSLLRTALLTGYSRRAEDEADSEALKYLLKSGRWNPVAMLSVLQGLARMDQTRPPRELGILQTHPYAADRAERVRKLLTDMKIEINLRPVVGSMVPSAKAIEVKGQQVGQVSIDERVIFQPAASSNGAGPVERAQKISKALSELLRAGLQLVEIRQEQRGDSVVIRARGRDLIEVLPGDAQFHGMSLQQLSEQVMQNLRLAFYAEKAKRAY